MPEYRNYNPNSKYGRRKAREQAARNYANGTPEYRKERDEFIGCFWMCAIAIIIIVFIIVGITSGHQKAIDVIK